MVFLRVQFYLRSVFLLVVSRVSTNESRPCWPRWCAGGNSDGGPLRPVVLGGEGGHTGPPRAVPQPLPRDRDRKDGPDWR